jgi:DNA polymerase III delta prime subunit|uniref:AAA+ ATPase domain-containing protein n=1 Tax=viral metagenome TaxID=1070528 RepID=A0A6C0IMI6_9ZZZZ
MSYNIILERQETEKKIKEFLHNFHENSDNLMFKKGIYVYGSSGSGKTHFINNILKEMNYDIIKYDAGDVRNKSLIETITSNNISNRNVLNMMKREEKKIAIIMDEIDGMNNGDKGGINALIKIIRQKKTRKQKAESMTKNPIICIGNYYIDKKIRELMKVCNTYELKTPTTNQLGKIVLQHYPNIQPISKQVFIDYSQGDIRKLHTVFDLIKNNNDKIDDNLLEIFKIKNFNDDAKNTTKMLINNHYPLHSHNKVMNETDRTIIALLWHENIVDTFKNYPLKKVIPVYCKILKSTCFADYIDRITFQNQIWQFNEMSSLIKTFYNNKIYHDNFPENKNTYQPQEVRFTKVLTKYSTEYNNSLFIFNLCQELEMEKKDVVAFFQELRLYFETDFSNNAELLLEIETLFENYNIGKLDIKRIYRYLDKNIKKDLEEIEE